MNNIFLNDVFFQQDDLRVLKIRALSSNTYLAKVSYLRDNFASTSNRILKYCGDVDKAYYESDFVRWSREVSGVNMPNVEVLKIAGREDWLDIDYVNGISVDDVLSTATDIRQIHDLYGRMVDILARFQAKTHRTLKLQEGPKIPDSIVAFWATRSRETPIDYNDRLIKSSEEIDDIQLSMFIERLNSSQSFLNITRLMSNYPLRAIAKDANPRNWIIGEDNLIMIDFSETAIDMGLRDLANLLTYNLSVINKFTNQLDRFLYQHLESYFAKFFFYYGNHFALPSSLPFFWAAAIYSTVRRFPSFIKHDKSRVSQWLLEIPLLCGFLRDALQNKDVLQGNPGAFDPLEIGTICQDYRSTL